MCLRRSWDTQRIRGVAVACVYALYKSTFTLHYIYLHYNKRQCVGLLWRWAVGRGEWWAEVSSKVSPHQDCSLCTSHCRPTRALHPAHTQRSDCDPAEQKTTTLQRPRKTKQKHSTAFIARSCYLHLRNRHNFSYVSFCTILLNMLSFAFRMANNDAK